MQYWSYKCELYITELFYTYLILVNRFTTDNTNPITDRTSLNFSYSSLYLNLKVNKCYETTLNAT